MTRIAEIMTEQGNCIAILATEREPMDFFVRINGNIRPIKEAIYQMNRTKEYEARVAKIGSSLYA